jgi:hypothetical protein
MEKLCFKADGTNGRGTLIIKALEKMGGINHSNYNANNSESYYYLDDKNRITFECELPCGFDIANPTEVLLKNVYPKRMYVSDRRIMTKVPFDIRTVVSEMTLPNGEVRYIAINGGNDNFFGWRFAADVEDEVKKAIELTLDQIAEKFNIPVSQLKIKK